jgi:hypothetical protein
MDITSIWPGSLVNEAFKIVEILELNFGSGSTCTIFTLFRSFKIGKQNLSPLEEKSNIPRPLYLGILAGIFGDILRYSLGIFPE